MRKVRVDGSGGADEAAWSRVGVVTGCIGGGGGTWGAGVGAKPMMAWTGWGKGCGGPSGGRGGPPVLVERRRRRVIRGKEKEGGDAGDRPSMCM